MCKMWAEKWESWQLRRQRQRLENAYRPPAGATPDELLSLSSERSMELQPVQRRLWEIQTAELRRCADRWAIDVEAKWDDSGRATGHAFFSSRDRHDLERKIKARAPRVLEVPRRHNSAASVARGGAGRDTVPLSA